MSIQLDKSFRLMIDRILDFSNRAASLRIRNRQLDVRFKEDEQQVQIPVSDIAVVVIANPQVHFSHAVLSELCDHGAVLIVCDSSSLPTGMLLPLNAHHWQVSRFEQQAKIKLPLKKALWQQVVRQKVRNQAASLERAIGSDRGLKHLATQVRSGDPSNVEAQAARRYWSAMFGDSTFKRDRDAKDENLLLNYGYAVLRAIVARAICASGLHPSLGIHHHNRGSGYPLADDLMEPFRPVVDVAVWNFVSENHVPSSLSTLEKQHIISHLLSKFVYLGEQRTLFDIACRTARSLVRAIEGETRKLELPEF